MLKRETRFRTDEAGEEVDVTAGGTSGFATVRVLERREGSAASLGAVSGSPNGVLGRRLEAGGRGGAGRRKDGALESARAISGLAFPFASAGGCLFGSPPFVSTCEAVGGSGKRLLLPSRAPSTVTGSGEFCSERASGLVVVDAVVSSVGCCAPDRRTAVTAVAPSSLVSEAELTTLAASSSSDSGVC